MGLILFFVTIGLWLDALTVDGVVRQEGVLALISLADLLAGIASFALLARYHRGRQMGRIQSPAGTFPGAPSFPLAVALVALSAVSSISLVGAVYAMATVARTRRVRDIAILGGVAALAATANAVISSRAFGATYDSHLVDALAAAGGFLLIWMICTLIGLVRGSRDAAMAALAQEAEVARREHESMLRVRHAEAQVLESRVEQARQAERAQITRELHDTLAHHLSLVSIHAGALEYRDDLTPEQTRAAAGAVAEAARSAGADLRVALGVLREGEVAPEPVPDLNDLAALLDQLPPGAAQLVVRPPLTSADLTSLSALASRHLYRIAQECLTNARKHAPGACVNLTISGEVGAGVVLEARNRTDVSASRPAGIAGSGLGLVGLAERTRLAGGGSRVQNGDGEFTLTAWVPWNA